MARSRTQTTFRDVAREVGVSVSTVSRVLNDKDGVAPETYEKVKSVIQRLGCTSSRKSPIVAVPVTPSATYPVGQGPGHSQT